MDFLDGRNILSLHVVVTNHVNTVNILKGYEVLIITNQEYTFKQTAIAYM